MKDLYTENYKALLKQIKDTRHKQIKTQINYLWIGRLNAVKMTIFLKNGLQVQHSPYQNPTSIWKCKEPRRVKTILKTPQLKNSNLNPNVLQLMSG